MGDEEGKSKEVTNPHRSPHQSAAGWPEFVTHPTPAAVRSRFFSFVS